MKEYVTLATYTYSYEISILKLLLEQKSIRHHFRNEVILGVFPFSSNALGGIKLDVHPEDIQEAIAILNKFRDDRSPLRII